MLPQESTWNISNAFRRRHSTTPRMVLTSRTRSSWEISRGGLRSLASSEPKVTGRCRNIQIGPKHRGKIVYRHFVEVTMFTNHVKKLNQGLQDQVMLQRYLTYLPAMRCPTNLMPTAKTGRPLYQMDQLLHLRAFFLCWNSCAALVAIYDQCIPRIPLYRIGISFKKMEERAYYERQESSRTNQKSAMGWEVHENTA